MYCYVTPSRRALLSHTILKYPVGKTWPHIILPHEPGYHSSPRRHQLHKIRDKELDTEVRIVCVCRIRWYKTGTVSTEEIYPLVIWFLWEQLGLVFI